MNTESDKKWYKSYKGWLIALSIIFVIFIWYRSGQDGYQWDGQGSVNLFPANAGSKNYRVDADMKVTRKVKGLLTVYYEYKIKNVTWPNGGTVFFDGSCTINGENNNKFDDCTLDGREYRVEVDTVPEMPVEDFRDNDMG